MFGLWFAALAAASPVVPYQGRLIAADGTPLDGPTDLTIRLYSSASSPTALFTATFDDHPVEQGYFLTVLETGTGGATIEPQWLAGDVWVGVQVGTAAEMTPRTPIHDVPRAVVATHLPISTTTVSGSCLDAGRAQWDAALSTLWFCDGSTWREVGVSTPPVLTAVVPSSSAYGVPLTITGSGFRSTDTFRVGGTDCATTFVSATQVTCALTPYVAHSTAHAITVVRNGTTLASLPSAYTRTASTTTFTSTGSSSWTAPAGVTSVSYQLWGGGGGGGGVTTLHTGSGGGGGYSAGTATVVGGTAYPYTVGIGGTRGTCAVSMVGQTGGTTTMFGQSALGGAGGSPHGVGGAGGVGTTATGQAGNGSDVVGGAGAGPGGGAGGVASGSSGGCHNDGNGTAPGGGGSGRYGSNSHGGHGARGEIRLSW